MAETTLLAMAERYGINTMVDIINQDANSLTNLDDWRKEYFYDTMMLEKIKIGTENYVYLQYATPYPIPKGHEKWKIRKNYPLTEHTTPLLEGIPPRSDKMKKSGLTGTFHQYGRYMEFTERIEWTLLDPVMMEYASEYGDVAVRTMHRLARKELLNSTFKLYANNKTSIGELVIGDYIGLATYRLAALKMSRLAVRPINGVFPVITSEEHLWDLMNDPLIEEYIGTNNGMSHFATGELPVLFKIKFMTTQMDDFAYGYELGNPGEFNDGADKCRFYAANVAGDDYLYVNLTSAARAIYVSPEYRSDSDFGYDSRSQEEGTQILGGADLSDDTSVAGINDASETFNRLSDGSWIPIRALWTFSIQAYDFSGATDMAVALSADETTETVFYDNIYYTYDHTGGTTEKEFTLWLKDDTTFYDLGTVTTTDSKLTKAAIAATIAQLATDATKGTFGSAVGDVAAVNAMFKQLPVHKAIMLGEGALARLEVAEQGNVKMYMKPKGSAGVLDPIDQRQSIGFKLNTIGFKLVREECVWICYHVPSQATATAGISLGLTGAQITAL